MRRSASWLQVPVLAQLHVPIHSRFISELAEQLGGVEVEHQRLELIVIEDLLEDLFTAVAS